MKALIFIPAILGAIVGAVGALNAGNASASIAWLVASVAWFSSAILAYQLDGAVKERK